MSLKRPVRILPPEVARKIAAGEVIDRPNAIVRELMDNAIDSGADSITVEIYGGGIDKIRVIDNGSGMSREDMEIAATPHATSKISSEQDLLNLSTLGFRGEALSSIAAVSKLTIVSGEYKLETSVTEKNKITQVTPFNGTTVQSENLFQNFPARRMFLKRSTTEGKMCFNTFIEKALPFCNIEFRFYQDGELKLNLPKEDSIQKRFTAACDYGRQKDLFFTQKNHAQDNSWSFELIIGEPGIYRNDRKEISIFVNNRKISEYSLMQAIEYGCMGYFPNGTHPVAALFVTIDSKLVDFNIHPAKKEVRFKDINELHHSVSNTTASFFKNSTIKSLKPELDASYYENTFSKELFQSPVSQSDTDYTGESGLSRYERLNAPTSTNSFKSIEEKSYNSDLRSVFMNNSKATYAQKLAEMAYQEDEKTEPQTDSIPQNAVNSDSIKYFGTTLGVFLLVEKDNTLYLIDQHAAHERILYDSIMTTKAKSQKLLIPYQLESQSTADDEYLESVKDQLEEKGFILKNNGNGSWQITEVHERWTGTERDLQTLLLDQKIAPDKILTYIAASTACKAAVKDGYYLDSETAKELAVKALSLPDPHCPHGRPVWTAITKEKMFELVKRITK
ncbi:MAG: DNA mismatch repair endonuclease MutL [Treponema sp.]|uniref:DNA mismatch repair endonuclease MutL n=1 Tax=Treponema sp. TaxID=166 RepID=UPI00298E60A9|nr:DNA mismatch repair endonuclease MutL [Treponema sp.]MDD5811310.1 DNA mismatch repair endonuclease MutL [Treponema sp.]